MRRFGSRSWVLVRAGAVATALLTAAAAGATTFTVALSGPAESPPNASPGTGQATVTYDAFAHTLTVNVSFSGLVGTTTAAHIHCCTTTPGTGTAGVATQTPTFTGFPLGVTSGTYDHTFDMTDTASYNPAFITANGGTAAGAEAALSAGMTAGKAYLNIHSTQVPGGEIRGFLDLVLEPVPALSRPAVGLLLLVLGAAAVLALRRG